jgi:hypothetical protein
MSPSLRRQLEVEGDPEVGTLTITVQDGSSERAATDRQRRRLRVPGGGPWGAARASRARRCGARERAGGDRGTHRRPRRARHRRGRGRRRSGQHDLAGPDRCPHPAAARDRRAHPAAARRRAAVRLRCRVRRGGAAADSPVAPTPARTAAATAFLGALLASAAAYWLAGRGHRITSEDDPARILGVPMLGMLPTYEVREHASLRERALLDPRTAEAYRFAYSSLDLVLREAGARSVLITSATPSAGKTETALQLALTARSRDRAVLLVDGDLRMRGLTVLLRATRAPGLLDLADGYDPTVVGPHWFADGQFLPVLTAGGSGTTGHRRAARGVALPGLPAADRGTRADPRRLATTSRRRRDRDARRAHRRGGPRRP